MDRVIFPPSLSARALSVFSTRLNERCGISAIEIDFGESRWGTPFWFLLAASHINQFRAKSPTTRLSCSNYGHLGYPAHIGFFQAFGLPYGNAPGAISGNDNYVPITVLPCADLRIEADRQGINVGELIEERASRLAHILCRGANDAVLETLTYCMREIMRNVVEHSETDRIAFCAQFWPARKCVEVGINDWGIGLRESLQRNPELSAATDADALRLALMPGVSGKGAIVKRLRHRTPWTNSGYGLYMTSRICRKAGSFLIGSGSAALQLSQSTEASAPWDHTGTAVRLELGVGNLDAISVALERFRREADEFCRAFPREERMSASLASRMLARDFSQ